MAITVAAIEALMDLATASVEAGDYDLAINRAVQAQGKLALLASGSQKGEIEVTTDWNHQAIHDFIDNVRKLKNSVAVNSVNGPFTQFQYQFRTRNPELESDEFA